MSTESSNPSDAGTTDRPDSGSAPTLEQAVMSRPVFDPAAKTIQIPTPVQGGMLTFKLGQKTLTEEQMTFLAPMGIRADWHPAYVIAFLTDCAERGFNPWSGEAFLLRYPDGYVRHIGIAGWLRSAEESREFEGLDQVVFFDQADKAHLRWPHRDQVPYAAECTVYRRGRRPTAVPVLYHEYVPMVDDVETIELPDGKRWKVPTGKGRVPVPKWRTGIEGGMATMLMAKVARAASLRLQFPRFAGWYEPTELERAAVQVRAWNGGQAAEERRAAYAEQQAAKQDGRTVDGAEVGATVRETVTLTRPAADPARRWTAPEAKARLLAELRAQAELLGMTVDAMTRRWSAARGGRPFDQASVVDMTAYVQRFRVYVIDRLRATGRNDLAVVYAAAPPIGSLAELFGTDEPWTVPSGEQPAGERVTAGAAA